MPSASVTRSTSSTESFIACCSAMTPSRPWVAAYRRRVPAIEAVSQPPLRPLAPKPQNRASSSTTRSEGSAAFR